MPQSSPCDHHQSEQPRFDEYDALIFDMDGTLTIPSYERGVARLLRYDRHP